MRAVSRPGATAHAFPCIAVIEGGRPKVVANAEGHRTTPSVVAYAKKTKDLLVGKIAKRQAVTNPENTFYSVKRFVGCTREEVTDDLRKVAYGVKEDGNRLKIDCPVMAKAFAPEEVSAQVLRKLAADCNTLRPLRTHLPLSRPPCRHCQLLVMSPEPGAQRRDPAAADRPGHSGDRP